MARLRLHTNPIVIKELRSRMRGPRAFVILTAFLLLLGLFTYGLYRIVTYSSNMGGGATLGAVIGRTVFIGLAFFELMLVCLFTPALTAGAISSEEERKTLDILLATPLRAASVLWGKLISALTYVFLLILAAVPLASIVFILGGVTTSDLLDSLAILALCAVAFGTLGLFFSVLLRRTGRATVASYIVLLLLMFGIYFIYAFVAVTMRTEPPRSILYASPIAAMAAAAGGDVQPSTISAMAGPFPSILWLLSGSASGAIMGKVGPGVTASGMTLRPLWHYTMGIYGIGTAALYLLSVQLLKPIRRWRIGRPGALGLAISLVLLAGAGYAFYGPVSYSRFGYPALPTGTVPTMSAPVVMMAGKAGVAAVAVPVATLEPLKAITVTANATVTSVPPPTPTPAAERKTTLDGTPVIRLEMANATTEETGEIYSAAMSRLIEEATAPDIVTLLDTTSAGRLADPKIDGQAPTVLSPDVVRIITERVSKAEGISISLLKQGDEALLQSHNALFTLGSIARLDDGRVKVPISRDYGSGPHDTRIYTLKRGDGGWAVVEDSGVLVEDKG
jgi:ABC-2 type transport system permease protein